MANSDYILDTPSIDSADEHPRKAYSPPRLQIFGSVSALTRNNTGSCQDDGNNACGGAGNQMGPMPSDPRIKENVVRIGTHPLNIGLYLFDYKPEYREKLGSARQFGVMADEVERVMPDAVQIHLEGYRMVDYGMLGIERTLS